MKVRKNWRKSYRNPDHVQHQWSADGRLVCTMTSISRSVPGGFAWTFRQFCVFILRLWGVAAYSINCWFIDFIFWDLEWAVFTALCHDAVGFLFSYVFRFIIIFYLLSSISSFFCVFPFHPNGSEWVSTLQSQALMALVLHCLCEHVEPVGSCRVFFPQSSGCGVVERITAVRALEKECCSTREHQPRPAEPVHTSSELNWTELNWRKTPHLTQSTRSKRPHDDKRWWMSWNRFL